MARSGQVSSPQIPLDLILEQDLELAADISDGRGEAGFLCLLMIDLEGGGRAEMDLASFPHARTSRHRHVMLGRVDDGDENWEILPLMLWTPQLATC